MRTPGYTVTVKLFVPAPRDDFKAQAAAAALMQMVVTDKVLPVDLLSAHVLDVTGKYGSVDLPEKPASAAAKPKAA